jgi:hypothetical protein
MSNANNEHRSLPEVSVNPHIQSVVQETNESTLADHEKRSNDLFDQHSRSQSRTRNHLFNDNSNATTVNHRHVHVTPTNVPKRVASPIKTQIITVKPNLTVQYQRTTTRPDSATNIRVPLPNDLLNEAYIERDHVRTHVTTTDRTNPTHGNGNGLARRQQDDQYERNRNTPNLLTPASSPLPNASDNHRWKTSRSDYPNEVSSKQTNRRDQRAPSRLKNYADGSGSTNETTEIVGSDAGTYLH